MDNCAVNFNENLTSNEIKVTNVYEEDLSGEVEVTKDAGYTTDCKDVFEPTEAKEMSYIGETARPLRERVVEHMSNLKNGSMKSFIISHWMDVHGTSVVAPEFKWQVLDKYSDALRRQLAEGLHIMNSGVLNKKVEFSTNIICRMQATTTATTSEAELQKELDERRVYKDKLRNFVSVMSKISPDFDHMRSKNMKKKIQTVRASNKFICYRSNSVKNFFTTSVVKRKRQNMECSTPVSGRREPPQLLGEDSPILGDSSNSSSSTYSESADVISQMKRKAGMSNEVDSMVVTPSKECSPDTMDKRLALHTAAIVRAAVNNPLVMELQEQETHTTTLAENSFAKRDTKETGAILVDDEGQGAMVEAQSVGMDGMNKDLFRGGEQVKVSRSVDMDGMNKDPLQGGVQVDGVLDRKEGSKEDVGGARDGSGAAGMNEMNKTPMRGGGNEQLKVFERKKAKATRRVSDADKGKVSIRLQLGEQASKKLLDARACPSAPSPKRPTPMEVDPPSTPANKKRKSKHGRNKTAPDQRLITDVWNKRRNDKKEEDGERRDY